MKIIGILGGLGPESTIAYYKKLIGYYKAEIDKNSFPHIIINSIDLSLVTNLLNKSDLDGLVSYLAEEINRLKKAGANIIAMASNTPHIVFDKLQQMVDTDLLSIVEVAASEAKKLNLKKLGLLGTKFTMQSTFFHEVFNKSGIEVISPDMTAQACIIEKYTNELIKGIALEETRLKFYAIIQQMIQDNNVDGIIVGCTEFPLVMQQSDYPNITLIDTQELHIKAIVHLLAQ